VVSNFARRLDKIERQLRERLNENLGPVYLREGTTIPEGIAPERVIFIERVIVEPPEHPEEPAWLNENLGPVYLREGEAIPEGVAPERVTFIERVIIGPPEHPEEPALVMPKGTFRG
jgi:UDP-glucose 6-dehydrogenase